jgi:hypothetical protein
MSAEASSGVVANCVLVNLSKQPILLLASAGQYELALLPAGSSRFVNILQHAPESHPEFVENWGSEASFCLEESALRSARVIPPQVSRRLRIHLTPQSDVELVLTKTRSWRLKLEVAPASAVRKIVQKLATEKSRPWNWREVGIDET